MRFEQMTTLPLRLRSKYMASLAELENKLRTVGLNTEEIEQLKTKARGNVLGYLTEVYNERINNESKTS